MTDHKMTIRVPKELHKAARMKALESDVTLSDAVREFLRRWVEGEIELLTQETQEGHIEDT